MFWKSSAATQFVCFVFDETEVCEKIIAAVKSAVYDGKKIFLKIAFVGLDRRSVSMVKRAVSGKDAEIGFLKGLEDAKEWLLARQNFLCNLLKSEFPP